MPDTLAVLNQHVTDHFSLYNADCVEFLSGLPADSIDFSVYSPPYANLYIYSESERDMGNVASQAEFQAMYRHAVREKLRVTKPGRLTAIHVKDTVYYSNASERGDRGVYPFSDDCIRTHREEGWTFHCRVTIWRDPVQEQTKTKPDGLLYKNFRGDAGRVRVGMPEYLLVFRKWDEAAQQADPIIHDYIRWRDWAGEGERFVQKGHLAADKFEAEYYEALDIWQNWASPIWTDTNPTNVLNSGQNDPEAERHLCPMPIDLTDRAVRLWSNAGDVVLSPFAGIGSEGYAALKAGRHFIGVELEPKYYRQAIKNLTTASENSARLDLARVAAQ